MEKIAAVAFLLALPAVLYMLFNRERGLALPDHNWILNIHILPGSMKIITGTLFVANQ